MKTTLNNGVEIPMLGFGVYQILPGQETERAVLDALRFGYRHVDTARAYANEADVGRAIRQSGIPRGDIFITTKLANQDHGYSSTIRACEISLEALGVDVIDLYLIHWPVLEHRADSWAAMETLYKEGKVRAAGVSNYTERHLRELLTHSALVPAINQVEFNPFLYQKELLDFCAEQTIRLEAYSPLAQGRRLDHADVVALAKQHARTPAQIMLRWALQHDVIVIPKSVTPERIESNARVFDFELSPAEMHLLDGLNEDLRTCWDPTNAP